MLLTSKMTITEIYESISEAAAETITGSRSFPSFKNHVGVLEDIADKSGYIIDAQKILSDVEAEVLESLKNVPVLSGFMGFGKAI